MTLENYREWLEETRDASQGIAAVLINRRTALGYSIQAAATDFAPVAGVSPAVALEMIRYVERGDVLGSRSYIGIKNNRAVRMERLKAYVDHQGFPEDVHEELHNKIRFIESKAREML